MFEKARNFTNAQNRDALISTMIVEELPRVGVEGKCKTVKVKLHSGGKSREIGQMFEKEIDLKRLSSSGPEVLKKHQWLKSHKFPVVPTLRFNEKTNSILQTDMKTVYVKIVDKHNPLNSSEVLPNEKEVIEQIQQISKNSYDDGNGIFLSLDAYSIGIRKDGTGEVILLDIGAGTMKLKNGSFKDHPSDIISEESCTDIGLITTYELGLDY